MPRTKQKARKKGVKGGGGGGSSKGEGEGEGEGAASASSSGAHAQPETTTSSTSSSSKTPANASHARDDSSSSSENEHPSKKHKPDVAEPREATNDHSNDAGQPLPSHDDAAQLSPSPLEDLTAVALDGEDSSKDTSKVRSAFGFSPAKAPAANVAWSSPTHRPSTLPPRYALASSASAQQWKMSAIQRHVDSFKFFSRDVLSRWAMPDHDLNWMSHPEDHGLRVDSFDVTGSLVWLQAEAFVDMSPFDDQRDVRGSTFVESAGRSLGSQRYIGTNEEEMWDCKYQKNKRGEHYLSESHLGFGRHLHPQLNRDPYTDVRLHRFDSESERLRGLAGNDFDYTRAGYWSGYDMPQFQTVLNASCRPELLTDAACFEVLHPSKNLKKGSKRPTELHVVLLWEMDYGEDDDDEDYFGGLSMWGAHLGSIHWAPSGKSIVEIPPPHEKERTATAISEGTAYCWAGYSDGRIELFDPSAYSFEVMSKRKSHNNIYSARGFIPDFRVVVPASDARGYVTSLLSVGSAELVATFSKGQMLLLRATSSKTVEIIREFVGLGAEGGRTVTCNHTQSRLVAASSTDHQIRIWHLDEPYPLNSAWHRQRRGRKALDLFAKPVVKAKQPEAKSSTSNAAQGASSSTQDTTTTVAPAASSAAPGATSTSSATSSAPNIAAATPAPGSLPTSSIPPAVPLTINTAASAAEAAMAAMAAKSAKSTKPPQPAGPSLELLAIRDLTDAKAKKVAQKGLSELHWRNPCGMTFAPTSWVADRDAQWEMTRDFEGDDGDGGLKPKVISTGLLPTMVCGTSSLRGPMLIYFEAERKVGVEIKNDDEAGPAQNEGVKKEKKCAEGANGGEQEGPGSSTSLLAQS